ncbi:GNAT family N-acetyltransferase [Flavobacterium sp.]|uniref:GNAT family N-acetyltransferase n=1 Tax=Flavobacterium sp. TaxID=239 RepID=UPI002B4B87EF|nr:GNAT family N-acetyltransferase [Flavobacterium sp.]HLP63754.1 GNAT family N-acetyltransferase [Flavobacterium sp.]
MKLRPWKIEDAENLANYANNPKVAQCLTNAFPHPYTIENAKSFIEMVSNQNPTAIFAIDIDDEALGSIGLHAQTDIMCKNMELGYFLGEPFWGKGITTEAVKQMVEYGFENFDVTRIYARPYGNNLASQKVLEKAGFTLEARIEKNIYKNGEFLDELIYAVRKKIN